jgi:hypothetical protein
MDTYIARRAQIVEDEPDQVADAADANVRYNVVNTRTGKVVGSALSRKRARTILDKHDNAYGGYIHRIVPVPIIVAPELAG